MAEQLRGPFAKFVDSPYYSVYLRFREVVERSKKCIFFQGKNMLETSIYIELN
jgi:hypothetical protein